MSSSEKKSNNMIYKVLAAGVALCFAYFVSRGGAGNIANLSKASNEAVLAVSIL